MYVWFICISLINTNLCAILKCKNNEIVHTPTDDIHVVIIYFVFSLIVQVHRLESVVFPRQLILPFTRIENM